MNIYVKSGSEISSKSRSGHIKIDELGTYRVLCMDFKEIAVKLISTEAKIIHPKNKEDLNLILENIEAGSKDFGVQYLAKVDGWELSDIKYVFEKHKFQFVLNPIFLLIFCFLTSYVVHILFNKFFFFLRGF